MTALRSTLPALPPKHPAQPPFPQILSHDNGDRFHGDGTNDLRQIAMAGRQDRVKVIFDRDG